MNHPPEAETQSNPAHSDDLAHADDAVIGVAVRRSLMALVALAVVVLVVVAVMRRPDEATPEQTIKTAAPVAVVPATEATVPTVTFTEISAAAGIDFTHENGAGGDKLLPESMGSGVALFDADNDGDIDILLINGRPWTATAGAENISSRFFRNQGTDAAGNLQFTDATIEAGLALGIYGTGVAAADVDGDGWRDVFVAAVGSNRLLMNRHGRFEDVSDTAGVAGSDDAWSTSCAFFDADNDGDLDLFVGNYVRWSRAIDFEIDYQLTGVGRAYGPPANYQGSFSALYRNDLDAPGGNPAFTDISEAAGLHVRNNASGVPVGKALAVAPIDVDGDGWMDLVVANDTVRNFLFHNRTATTNGNAITFDEVGELWGIAYGREGEATGAMGIDAGYLRNDGDLGFAIGNFANEMTSLYVAQGDRTLYADEAITEGIGASSRAVLSFGVLFFDYDLDGRLDLIQTNGHLETEINTVDPSQTYAQPSQLFWNAGPEARRTFEPVDLTTAGDLGQAVVGRGSATADLDGDGDLDVVLTQTGRRALVLRNDQALANHWLRIRLVDRAPNIDAIGAWITLETDDGRRQRRAVMPNRSYQSQSEPTVTFGLGKAATVTGLEVTWPDGTNQAVEVEAVDRLLMVERNPTSP